MKMEWRNKCPDGSAIAFLLQEHTGGEHLIPRCYELGDEEWRNRGRRSVEGFRQLRRLRPAHNNEQWGDEEWEDAYYLKKAREKRQKRLKSSFDEMDEDEEVGRGCWHINGRTYCSDEMDDEEVGWGGSTACLNQCYRTTNGLNCKSRCRNRRL
jgi:hypothetical protein